MLSRLRESDLEDAIALLFSPTTWVVAFRGVETPDKLRSYLSNFIASDARGEALTLVARLKETGEIAGISRYHSAAPNFTRVEIGYTWIADQWMRTFVNTEKKFLMMRHAFEEIGVKRVEFSVDPRNDKSNDAVRRIGGTFEGTLRKWRFLSEQDKGDRNIYSVLDDEWPRVKAHLIQLMER
jgi:RimJ/RimL family protein N-acetyltransferase